jgi:hypothetical protein
MRSGVVCRKSPLPSPRTAFGILPEFRQYLLQVCAVGGCPGQPLQYPTLPLHLLLQLRNHVVLRGALPSIGPSM